MIYVSTAAWEYLKGATEDYFGIKVELKGAGCSGFEIKTSIKESGPSKEEYCFKIKHPSDLVTTMLRIIVNKEELDRFDGMNIILEEEGLNKKIKYNLLNVGNSCGCGNSFSFNS